MRVKLVTIISVIMMLLILGACSNESSAGDNSSGGEEYTFKMTYVTQSGHIWHKFAEKFDEELNENSDGRMELDLYPAAQLGEESDMVEQLENGSIDFAVLTVPYLSTRFPELDAWNMPFLFDDLEDVIEAQETDSAQEMLGLLENQGLLGMDYFFAANHNLGVKGDSIRNIDDVKGKKIRFTGGESVLDYWKDLGASPISMGLPEVYNAMQTGVMEGVSVDTNPMLSEKFYEVSDEYVLSNHMAFGGIVASSKMNFEEMSDEDQEIVKSSLEEAVSWGKQKLVDDEEKNLEELEDDVEIVELEDRDKFKEKAEAIYEKYSEENDLIKEFIDEVK